MKSDIWKYCNKSHTREFLLSLGLTGKLNLPEEKQLSLLYGLSNHAEEHYQKVQIPKRNGTWRTLYVPDSLLKYIQKQILHKILMQFPVSSCASAYKKGCALKENAAPHSGKPIVLKMDIWDFFGNITFISVYQHAFPGELFPHSVRTLLTHLCCYKDFLPQGQQQIITGLIVNEKAQVPKAYRRSLRQEIYYIEKFGLSEHLAHIHSDLTPERYLEKLKGRIRYILQINPQDKVFQEAFTHLNKIHISH